MSIDPTIIDLLAYHRLTWRTPSEAFALLQRCDSATQVLHAPRSQLVHILDSDWPIIEQLRADVDFAQAQRDAQRLAQLQIILLVRGSSDYPPMLETIIDPPLILFWRGLAPEWHNWICLAVVGTRKPSRYGRDVIPVLLEECVPACVIVSGLAFGVDADAHRLTLSRAGLTIGVLASGVDKITPYTHHALGLSVMQNGGLCSEVPLGVPSHPAHYPWRNRIISALSRAVLIVEATFRSGTLITARHAADQGRDVLAVPGPITSELSQGPNQLLRDGAIPCTSANDILSALKMDDQKNGGQSPNFDANTARLLDIITNEPCSVERLGAELQMPISQLLQSLTQLECASLITLLPGSRVVRA